MKQNPTQPDRQRALRDTLGRFPTGVAIVTAMGRDARPVGMTINSFSSVSLAPPLIAWCIDLRADSYPAFVNADRFAITVLAENQQDLAMRFASRGVDKFRGIEWTEAEAPLIPGGDAWFRCRRYRRFSLGDHAMLIGEIVEFGQHTNEPLVFANGRFQHLRGETAADEARAA
jgi:flavin reductase (DIM6/NTAB) family NADH-FMN oxidoreductase RutF